LVLGLNKFAFPFEAVETPSCTGTIDASFFKFTKGGSSYIPPNPPCCLTLFGLRFVPAFPIAVVLRCSVGDELLAAELTGLGRSVGRPLVLEVERIPALVRAQMMVPVERLEPLAADCTANLVVFAHGISLELYNGPKERAVLFHPNYYITTDKP
jgi:hypothetical protein